MTQSRDLRSDQPATGWVAAARPRGFVEHAVSALKPSAELQRFSELLSAFADLARERGDLRVRGSAFPPLGFAVRMQPEPTSAGGELCLWPAGGRLSTWSEGGQTLRGTGERSVHMDLTAGFRWEGLVFPDAERLAYTLLQWMQHGLVQVWEEVEGS